MIVLDIETTGLEPELHGLISIGAIDLHKPTDYFYGECRIREGEKIDGEALEINGFSYDEVRDKTKQSTRELLISFQEWLESRSIKMIGGLHIAAFDVPFINKKSLQCGVRLRLHRRSIDLHSIAYAKMQELGKVVPMTDGWSVMDIDFIPKFCGLPNEPKPHNALNGVRWEAECLNRLIYGKPLLKQFQRYQLPPYLLKRRREQKLI
jgi:DNA polymerase III epsilon subunit-like protein